MMPTIAEGALDFSSIVTSITGSFSTDQLLSLIGTGVGAAVGYLAIFIGARLIVKMVYKGLRGKRPI